MGTGSASQDTCLGPGCGTCYITAIGDKRWCEVEAIDALKRELAAAIEASHIVPRSKAARYTEVHDA